MEEGLQWNVKVNSSDDIRSQRINKSLAAMLTLRSDLVLVSCHSKLWQPHSEVQQHQLTSQDSCHVSIQQ